jgi:hypothetical protein
MVIEKEAGSSTLVSRKKGKLGPGNLGHALSARGNGMGIIIGKLYI